MTKNIQFFTVIFCFSLLSCSYNNEKCSVSSSKDSQIFNPEDWITIHCSSLGDQYFTNSASYSWKSIKGYGNQFFADGDITENVTKKMKILPSQFTDVYTENADAVTTKNLNDMLQKEAAEYVSAKAEVYNDIKIIRLLTDSGFSYETAIFVKDDIAEWILVCKTYCNDDPPVVLIARDQGVTH